jgi:hypothetical protein
MKNKKHTFSEIPEKRVIKSQALVFSSANYKGSEERAIEWNRH